MANAKRLAKNTLLMYIRMLVVMFVAIFTSRVVLDKLGIDDYGLYNAVASVVAIITFLNATLSTSTSRYLTFDLGKGDDKKIRLTFSTSFYAHLILAFIIVVVMETVGIWYMEHKFVIPDGRELATQIVFQISILTTAIAIIQVPFTASIMAHEDIGIYAYVGLFEVFAKLGVVYLLSISPFDKLIFYAVLIAIVQLVTTSLYVIACQKRYDEININERFDKDTLKGMLGFTGWTAFANLSNSMVVQGSTVLLNLFFPPAIIAAKALSNQVSHAIMGFVTNFRVALNPQIIKSYSVGEIDVFKRYTLLSTVVSFDLMLILGLPCIFTMKTILNLWLVDVPEQSVEFIQLAIFSQIIHTISSSTYIPFVASGKLKVNAIWSSVLNIGYFIILYIIFIFGGGALWSQWLYLIICMISVLFLRPILLKKELNFTYKEMIIYGWNCLKVLLFASAVSYVFYCILDESLIQQVILFVVVLLISTVSSWIFLEKSTQTYLMNIVKLKVNFHK